MGDAAIACVLYGGYFRERAKYAGEKLAYIFVDEKTDFAGLQRTVAEVIGAQLDAGSKMHFQSFTAVPAVPLYDVVDDRSVMFWKALAKEDRAKHPLIVTVESSGDRNPSFNWQRTPFQTIPDGDENSGRSHPEVPETSGGCMDAGMEEAARADASDVDLNMPTVTVEATATGGDWKNSNQSAWDNLDNINLSQVQPTVPDASPPEGHTYEHRNISRKDPLIVEPELERNAEPSGQPNVHPDIQAAGDPRSDDEAGSGDERSRINEVYAQGRMVEDIEVDQIFTTKRDLLNNLAVIALREKFEFRSYKSNKSLTVVRCAQEGCTWRVRATCVADGGCWMVTKVEKNHNHPSDLTTVRHRQATSWVVGECVRKKLVNPGRVFKPRDVIDDIRSCYGVDISYSVAWRAREFAYDNVRLGTAEESYAFLPAYLQVLKQTDPGATFYLQTDDESRFQYLFIAFGASLNGYRFCRPVVSIDATHLKGKYRRVLFMVVCHDANQQIFLIAIGIGESENDASWHWFLSRLKEVIGEPAGHVIVSDRHRSIQRAVEELFPVTFHGLCMYHLLNNLKAKFKSNRKHLDQYYYKAAKAYNIQEFHSLFFSLCCAVPGAKDYLEDVGLDKWTRFHSPCRRYNIMTTNISESMNAVLVKVRGYPITALVDECRLLLQRWFRERRAKAEACISTMSPDVEKKLQDRFKLARTMTILRADDHTFDVIDGEKNFVIDMSLWTCTCRRFQLEQLPCEHALAVVQHSPYALYDLCSPYYSREYWYESYRGVVYPMPHISDWRIPRDVADMNLLPPDVRTSSGRRRKRRIPSVGEERVHQRCSRCKEHGHNRSTCKNPIALHPNGECTSSNSGRPSQVPPPN